MSNINLTVRSWKIFYEFKTYIMKASLLVSFSQQKFSSEAYDSRLGHLWVARRLSPTRRTSPTIFKKGLPTHPGCNDAYFINDFVEFYWKRCNFRHVVLSRIVRNWNAYRDVTWRDVYGGSLHLNSIVRCSICDGNSNWISKGCAIIQKATPHTYWFSELQYLFCTFLSTS